MEELKMQNSEQEKDKSKSIVVDYSIDKDLQVNKDIREDVELGEEFKPENNERKKVKIYMP
ncbi:MAG: hypothetical protein GX490_04070 [Bacilli bacterium]|nr:hypothetical protein [Bacilli bacterium]